MMNRRKASIWKKAFTKHLQITSTDNGETLLNFWDQEQDKGLTTSYHFYSILFPSVLILVKAIRQKKKRMIAYLEYHLGSVTNSQKQSIDWWLPGFEEGGNREMLVKGYKVSITKNEYS